MDFTKYSDEELILALSDEDIAESEKMGITEYILNKYKALVKGQAKSMFILGGDGDDLIQEGMIGLFKAINDFDCGRDASFYTFARLCIQRQIYTAVEASNRKKHMPLNSYISFESRLTEDGETVEDTLEDDNEDNNPLEIMISKENVEALENAIEDSLSPFERSVIELKLTGMNYTDIARVLKKTDKAVDNALTRIKKKLEAFK